MVHPPCYCQPKKCNDKVCCTAQEGRDCHPDGHKKLKNGKYVYKVN